MHTAIQAVGIVIGLMAGFALSQYILMYMLKGENMRDILRNKNTKIWLGTFGWFIALVGAWVGWQLSLHLEHLAGF